MRVVSGKIKGIRFSPPKGFPSRPTTDFAKEGLFNVLEHRLSLFDLDILDLFAGTGNISFEFASREAGNITSVDQNFKCLRFIDEMAKKHGLDEDITTIKSEVLYYVERCNSTYDLIFADPPFDYKHYDKLVEKVLAGGLLREEGLLIIEHSARVHLEGLPQYVESKKYGNVVFSLFQMTVG
jgi:16S rRNA (guanine(966)-N(2))-methyltransferase RsmD